MKKMLLFLLLAALATVPISAFAIQTPLETAPRTTAVVWEDTDIQLVSYVAYLRVHPGFTSVNTSMVIHNNRPEAEATFLMGIPNQVDDGLRKITEMAVIADGRAQRLTTRRNTTQPDATNIKDQPTHWQVFSVKVGPGESKVIDCSFTITNLLEPNATEIVFLPLEYLKPWQGPIRHIQVIADLDFYPSSVFEPNPTIMPMSYDEGGRLTWRFNNVNTPPNIKFSYRSIDQIALTYIKQQVPQDKSLDNLIRLYRLKDFDNTIIDIDDYLVENPDTPIKKELMFIKALSYQNLYQLSPAMALFSQLETDPGFGSVGATIHNRIIYDRYQYMKDNASTEGFELYEYLQDAQVYLSGNDSYVTWIKDEFSGMTPPPTPEPPPPSPEPIEPEPTPIPDEKLVKDIVIGNITIAVEFIFLGFAVLIILILLLLRKKTRKNRGYLFR